MCDRCTIIECAFGSRDPLPPRIASLDVKPPISPDTNWNQTKASGKDDKDVNSLGPSVKVKSVLQPSASTLSGIYDSLVVTPQNKTSAQPNPSSLTFPRRSPAGGDTGTKWSDVVAFGSKAVQRANTNATTVLKTELPPNVLASMMEHGDLIDALMLNCPDFPTLYALVASCRTAKRAFEHHPQGVIKGMLRTMPQEMENLTVALIGINGTQIGTSHSIKTTMQIWLGNGPKPLTERLQRDPVEIVRRLALSFSAIDLFMEVIPKNCVNNFTDYKTVLASRVGLDYFQVTEPSSKHPLLQQTEWSDVPDDTEWVVPDLPAPGQGPQATSLPLNDKEMYRIKRALLRYEIFCAIFYLGPDRYFDKRGPLCRFSPVPASCRRRAFCKDQNIFMEEHIKPWEIGELAVVSHFMFDLVRNAYFHNYKTIRYGEAYDSCYGPWGNKNHGKNRHDDHEEVVDEFDNHMVWFASQGLTLLRKIYDNRRAGYEGLVGKTCEPRYRATELFIPFERCAGRRGSRGWDPSASWKADKVWPDTPGMELPSKGWLAKSPASDSFAYWGEKWMRKIGYFIWDRD